MLAGSSIALENSENSVPLQFGASSTETVGNSLLFLSVCFSCCPKLSQPVSRAGPFAQCPDPGWGFAVVLPAPAGTECGSSTACLPPAGQELLQVSCSQGSLGWHQHSLSWFLVAFNLCTGLGAGARFPGGFVCPGLSRQWQPMAGVGLWYLLGNSHLLACEELKSVAYF